MNNLNDMDICPLLTSNTIVDVDGKVSVGTQPCYCLKEGCSWWIEDKQKCAIAVMARESVRKR